MTNERTMIVKAALLFFAAASLALFTSAAVLAHGSKPHGHDAHNTGPVVKEQKLWGIAGDAADAIRTVDVTMGDDMRFYPTSMQVKQGETIRFRVKNTGALLHEFVIGTPEENAKHAELMLKFPGMEHDEPYMAHVNPGEVGEIVWTFNQEGTFEFACLIAGHFQAGMVGNITVAAQ